MATLRDIKTRIVGVSSTQQITKAMKMVAAAKLRRAQDNIINARPYMRKLNELLGRLMEVEKNIDSPLVVEREIKSVALIIVTSDNGLCGAFNMNIIRATEDLLRNEYAELNKNKAVTLYCIGKKGYEYFSKRNYQVAEGHIGVVKDLKFDFVTKLLNTISSKFKSGDFDKVIIIFNEFKSVMQQNLIINPILPIKINVEQTNEFISKREFIYEPDQQQIINSLLPKYLNAQLYRALLESYASELGARMTAMDLATENAKELIRQLKLLYNKERQSTITTEILEIVSGAEALKKG